MLVSCFPVFVDDVIVGWGLGSLANCIVVESIPIHLGTKKHSLLYQGNVISP